MTNEVEWMRSSLGAVWYAHNDQDVKMTICDRESDADFVNCDIFMDDGQNMKVNFEFHVVRLKPTLSDFKVYISHIDRSCEEGKASVDVVMSSEFPVVLTDLIAIDNDNYEPVIKVTTEWNGTSEEYRNLFVKYLGFPANE